MTATTNEKVEKILSYHIETSGDIDDIMDTLQEYGLLNEEGMKVKKRIREITWKGTPDTAKLDEIIEKRDKQAKSMNQKHHADILYRVIEDLTSLKSQQIPAVEEYKHRFIGKREGAIDCYCVDCGMSLGEYNETHKRIEKKSQPVEPVEQVEKLFPITYCPTCKKTLYANTPNICIKKK